MEVLRAIILGAIQGITEFLPISSSGHLVILDEMLGLDGKITTTESVLMHMGSLLAIMIVFRHDLAKLIYPRVDMRLLFLLFIASLPVALGGLFFKVLLPGPEAAWADAHILQSPWIAGFGLLVTAGMLWLAERPRELRVRLATVSDRDYWLVSLVGCAQMLALLPGISRSGATICTALMLYWVRSDAIRLSFLMGLLAIFGAGLVEARHMTAIETAPAVAGLGSSLVFSLLGLWLIKLIVHFQRLRWFAAYCVVAGLATLGFLSIRLFV